MYVRLSFREVPCTRCDVLWFAEWMDFCSSHGNTEDENPWQAALVRLRQFKNCRCSLFLALFSLCLKRLFRSDRDHKW
jgi:hypothetical protein